MIRTITAHATHRSVAIINALLATLVLLATPAAADRRASPGQ